MLPVYRVAVCGEELLQLNHMWALSAPRQTQPVHGPKQQSKPCCFALCRQHPWFTVHLPRYLAVMQADTVASSSTIDDDTVIEVWSSTDCGAEP